MKRPNYSAVVELCRRNALDAPSGDGGSFPQHSDTKRIAGPNLPEIKKPLWRNSMELLAEPPVDTVYLLEAVIPASAVILLSGREGVMKSWLVLEWAQAVAEGREWNGRPCEAGAVLYVDAEMPYPVFLSRLHAIGSSRNLNVLRWQDNGFPQRLDAPDLVQASKAHRLIILDTLKRYMRGLDENSSQDMAMVTEQLRQLTKYGATVLALHHSPKDPSKSGYRGSTELGAGVDIAYTLEKLSRDGRDMLQLTASKTRYSEDPRLTIKVTRSISRPIFEDVSGADTTEAQFASTADLAPLSELINRSGRELGRKPNQSEIVMKARELGLGSRKTLLRMLKQGEGTRWNALTDGRSLVYECIVPLFPPLGPEQVDNSDRSDSTPKLEGS